MSAQVFIAHSSKDAVWLQRLTTMLAPLSRFGLTCWDETKIEPGQHRQTQISAALAGARVAVLLVSSDFLAFDTMFEKELASALAVPSSERRLKIIWVAVRPCMWQHSVLATYQPANDPNRPLASLSDSEAESVLGVIGQQLMAAVGSATNSSENPYRGLSAFQVHETHLFFGRMELTEKLRESYASLLYNPQATRLLAILGPSGSGKSSVVRAGLLASLQQSESRLRPCHTAILKPGGRPIESLARALMPLLPHESTVLPAQRAIAIEQLLRDSAAPAEGLARFAADLPESAGHPLLVLVDQFEELYTLSSDASDQDLFVRLLLYAAQAWPAHVAIVLTLRSDFLGETQRFHRQLNRLVAEQSVIVPALSPDELREAISRPAERAGRPIDTATVELLLSEARGSQGALPLLEFALTGIWEGMERGEEPGATLRKLNGVGGALACEAQRIYDALPKEEQTTARRALVLLVQLGEGTKDTRRRVPISELCGRGEDSETVLSVLRKFSMESARLITLSGNGTEAIAEVAHEALFEHWIQLRSWIHESRTDRRFHDRATESARLWQGAGRPPGRLWRSPDLRLLREYKVRRPDELSPMLEEFLRAAERRQKREYVVRGGFMATLVVVLLLAAGIYLIKEHQRWLVANQAREKTRRLLVMSFGRHLSIKQDLPLEALLWLHQAQVRRSCVHYSDPYGALTYSPDGLRSVRLDEHGAATLEDTNTERVIAALRVPNHRITSAIFTSDGCAIITSSEDHIARVWNADAGYLSTELKGHSANVGSAMFSPDGHHIVTTNDERVARVWDADTGRLVAELQGHNKNLTGAAYSPNGRLIVTTDKSGTALVWTADAGHLLTKITGAVSATYSPDSRRIVGASWGCTAQVWEAATGVLILELKFDPDCDEIRDHVTNATYSPDGSVIVTEHSNDSCRVWDAGTGRLIAALKAPYAKFSIGGPGFW